jgi:hypothetical protein
MQHGKVPSLILFARSVGVILAADLEHLGIGKIPVPDGVAIFELNCFGRRGGFRRRRFTRVGGRLARSIALLSGLFGGDQFDIALAP